MGVLEEERILYRAGDRWFWTADSYPANSVSLRSISSDNFVVHDRESGRVIAEVDFVSAHSTLHEKAIYMLESDTYYVEQLDHRERRAEVRPIDSDYYTDAVTHTKVTILDTFDEAPEPSSPAAHGEVHVVKQVVGFKKIKFFTGENVGSGELDMPAVEMHTTAFWLEAPPEVLAAVPFGPEDRRDGIRGIRNAMRAVATTFLMCEAHDIGSAIGTGSRDAGPPHPEPGEAEPGPTDAVTRIFIYDNYPGGIGFSEPLWESRATLLAETLGLIGRCPCQAGCPSCVGPVGEIGRHGKAGGAGDSRGNPESRGGSGHLLSRRRCLTRSMARDRTGLAERIRRSRARIVHSGPASPAPAGAPPAETERPPLPAAVEGTAADDKRTRLARARELIRRTERGWKELRVTGSETTGSAPPDLRTAPQAPSFGSPEGDGAWADGEAESMPPPAGPAAEPREPFSREDHDFPLGSRYGGATLFRLTEVAEEECARLQIRPEEPGVDLSRALFLDTETSGLAGGTGTFAFLIGVGHVEEDRFRVTQFLMRSPVGEAAMLEELAVLADGRRDLVTYNGSSFDLPLLETRFALNGVPSPFRGVRHLDLLHRRAGCSSRGTRAPASPPWSGKSSRSSATTTFRGTGSPRCSSTSSATDTTPRWSRCCPTTATTSSRWPRSRSGRSSGWTTTGTATIPRTCTARDTTSGAAGNRRSRSRFWSGPSPPGSRAGTATAASSTSASGASSSATGPARSNSGARSAPPIPGSGWTC